MLAADFHRIAGIQIRLKFTQQITVNSAGTYGVTLTNATNCSKTKTFTVTASGIATIDDIF